MHYSYIYEDSPDCWNDIDTSLQQALCDWIKKNILPRKTSNPDHSSYGLKHCFQHNTGKYVYNGQFKAAMRLCGFEPVNERERNWHYCISKKSPAFQLWRYKRNSAE